MSTFATGDSLKMVAKRDDKQQAERCAREYTSDSKAVRIRHYPANRTEGQEPEIIWIKRYSGMNR